MSRIRGELPEPEEELLGIERPTPEEENRLEDERKENLRLRREMLMGLMRDPLFREWLMEELIGFNTFGRTFAATPTGFPDVAATEFHLGMKAAGWHLWETFDAIAPDLASMMRRGL